MSTVFIDFGELKSRVKIDDVVQMLNLQMRQTKPGELRMQCPVCGGDNRSLVVTPGHVRNDGSVGSYFCQVDKKGGDMIGLFAHINGLRRDQMNEAAMEIAKHFGPAQKPAPKADKQPQEPRKSGYDPLAYAARLDPTHEALKAIEVSPEVFQTFTAGYAKGGVHSGRLALPLHDHSGALIGHFSRSLKGESPLLKFVNGQDPGAHIFAAHLVEAGDLYIASDPLDVLVAYENGERNVVAFLTDGITQQQWEMLSSLMDQKKVERSYLWK